MARHVPTLTSNIKHLYFDTPPFFQFQIPIEVNPNRSNDRLGLIILGLDLEIGLGMVAHGAHLGCLLANNDVAAVAAVPNHVAVA